jgi:hypothetical protein
MGIVKELEVFAAVVGMRLDIGKLREIAFHNGKGTGEYADCEEFVIGDLLFLSKELMKQLRITDALIERWEYGGILFRVNLFIRNGILLGGHIYKYKNTTQSCHFRPTGYIMDPTQQEIRLVGRVLDYLG